MQNKQDLSLIPHQIDGNTIEQRVIDGYINATDMCAAANKRFIDYSTEYYTQAFVNALSAEIGIPSTELIQQVKEGIGAAPTKQASWIHPQIAVHLAQWLSPKFAVQVTKWVTEWVSNSATSSQMPYHLKRYMANRNNIPHTHFSILNELTIALIAPLESNGYTLPEHLVPDISEGKMFAKWLRDEHSINTKTLPSYDHTYPDGRVVSAKLYPNNLLPHFREHFHEVWIPNRAAGYFNEKDPKALPYLDRMLLIAAP